MAHAYTPGLRISERTEIVRERRLPLPGEVMVAVGDVVTAETIVARTELPGDVSNVHVANLLGIDASDVPDAMLVGEGAAVAREQVIARGGGFFGLFRGEVKSPVDGTIESISKVTGQVLLRARPRPLTVDAYVAGRAVEVLGEEGVAVAAEALFVQGIFGIGGEARGALRTAVTDPATPLEPAALTEAHTGAIVVGGAFADLSAIRAAIERRAAALIVGGVPYAALSELLGHPIGVAVTGHEQVGLTLIVTEGFGRIPMAHRTFELLRTAEGQLASVNGATQIRAGVIRPEIVVPLEPRRDNEQQSTPEEAKSVEIGSTVRIIREPFFGLLGSVSGLPPEPSPLETEARVRIAEVTLDDGRTVVVPRSNLERVEA